MIAGNQESNVPAPRLGDGPDERGPARGVAWWAIPRDLAFDEEILRQHSPEGGEKEIGGLGAALKVTEKSLIPFN